VHEKADLRQQRECEYRKLRNAVRRVQPACVGGGSAADWRDRPTDLGCSIHSRVIGTRMANMMALEITIADAKPIFRRDRRAPE
jgi:hypothetical protein